MLWKRNETENDMEMLIKILNCLMHLAGGTCDGKLIAYPLPTLHDEYDELVSSYHRQKLAATFLLSDDQVTKQLLPMVLDFVNDIQQKDVAEVASRCIAALVPRLSGSIKKTQIIRIGIEKGDVSQAAGSRLICCWVLGLLTASTLLSEADIESLFFQKMMGLCQDTDTDVRTCMCMQLDALARAVSTTKACADLLPELLELLQDEEEQVKIMAFRTLVSLYDFYPKKEREAQILPVLLDVIAYTPSYLIGPLASSFGRLVFKLFTLNDFCAESSSVLLAAFNRLGRHAENEVRLACAYNFPAVVLSFGANQYSAQLDELLQALTQDKVESVRITAVAGLHEIAHLLGQQRALRYIKAMSLTTLRDESAVVQGYMIARLPDVMPYFCTSVDDDQRMAYLETVLKHILQHHTVLSAGKWRDQLRVVSALEKLHPFLSPIQLFERIFPLLFEMMNAGARPVQLEAVRTLVVLHRENKVQTNRFNILVRLRKEYAQGKSYWQRSLFLDACDFAVSCYSRKYIRHVFVEPALDLLDDHVPNVRIKAASLLLAWKRCLDPKAPGDEKLLTRIRIVLEAPNEADRDVLAVLVHTRDHWADAIATSDEDNDRRVAAEEALGMHTDHDLFTSEAKWSEMLEYTLIVGKDGQVVRRARVKSIDIISKIRQHSKEMANPRSSSTSVPARQFSKLDAKPGGTKLPTTMVAKPTATSSAVSLPTCATLAPKSASAGLIARESKSATATTGSLKQITDPAKMATARSALIKAPPTTTTSAVASKAKVR
ncbi:hypothetical protein SPRG_10607 [Saprolegnia parasitica CBS 223.65]|uniref:Condensin complex subunit 1 C-terminal domain-containing protein n=1 Tax=Saprolegnia parasitica (strain CBS 223.65) TaxID=695850 RepID=A0A067C0B3_SAPPC|nr:hypothetical protein SPRG_10607 [Saprolegnia parasitica CBS 223.65]KDO24179.1 hypothetical protein SPRG_10607 [Saprolegnia parasitica CBS 223.65]|eukprot:XP_012205123.1 hypothetical protein SPRG_10607 [Saprolegnia parasitica CBS 223.65]